MEFQPLNMKIVKSAVNGATYDTVDYDEYRKNIDSYLNRSDVAVSVSYKGQDIVLPIKGKYSNQTETPGVYNAGCIDFMVYPKEDVLDKYIPQQTVELSNTMKVQDIIRAGDIVRHMDEPFITSPDNITNISISDQDQPEMKCLKMALNSKAMDLDKYANRFGDNFPNDKRQLKNHSCTLNIIKRFCDNCDMEALLILRNKSADVPNPMPQDVVVSLTENSISEEEN